MTTVWQSFLERFLAIVQAQPEAPALVVQGKVALSYAELCQRVATLAGCIRGHEGIVAISLPRSVELIIAELACWWAGAAFLPLDPNLPPARRDFILNDAGVQRVIPDAHVASIRPSPPHLTHPEELAYIIYTSGSTGQPRGVAIEHRGLVPLLDSQIAAFDLGPGARSLWILSPVFDASISDVGTALLSGATLFLEAEDDLRDLDQFIQILHDRQITHIDLPPALLRLIRPESMPASLRTLIIGGEPGPPAVVRQWARRFRMVNVYGPTEATVCTSLCVCDPETWTEPLLGQPIAGVTYHVLDEHLRPVALGEAGELCIEGDCLARGYVNRPELTARKFIHHEGRRLYRTADRVRWREDGEYVFLGRLDRQVKLHGKLIEPEEIEARLLEHPQVQNAAVVKRPLIEGGAEGLVAFIVPASSVLDAHEVREHLAQFVPAWMLPARMVFVDNLPRTASGKIDLTGLIKQPLLCPVSKTESEETSPTRRLLARLCRELVGIESIDWQESFFAQGGDSLTLLQLVVAASANGMVIPPPLLASERSLAEVARWLEDNTREPNIPTGAMDCDVLKQDAEHILATLPIEASRGERRGATGGLTPRRSPVVGATGGLTRRRSPECIFLTGATGFLGSYLLRELLERTQEEVICLVRAADSHQGRQRLEQTLASTGMRLPDRVRVLIGDLSQARFGLDLEEWRNLSERVDAIYHSAARVHLVLPYETLRPDNLLGTGEVLRLAGTGHSKRIHFISTLSVFVATDRNQGTLEESDDLRSTRWVSGGYAQSKWAAEWLVRRAGLGRTAIYRPGLITGDSQTGRTASNDFLTLFIRGIIQLGCLPPIRDLRIDITPVDYAARAIVHLSLCSMTPALQTFHVAGQGSLSLNAIVAALARRGICLERVDASTFLRRIAELERTVPAVAAACLGLCRGLPVADAFSRYRTLDLFQATDVVFDMHNTQAGLAGSGMVCPAPNDRLLDLYFDQYLP